MDFKIQELMRSSTYNEVLSKAENRAWMFLKMFPLISLGKCLTKTMKMGLMHSLQSLGARMYTKMHFLTSHLN